MAKEHPVERQAGEVRARNGSPIKGSSTGFPRLSKMGERMTKFVVCHKKRVLLGSGNFLKSMESQGGGRQRDNFDKDIILLLSLSSETCIIEVYDAI